MIRSARSVQPTLIDLGNGFALDGPPRADDAAAHRLFALDPDAARFFGWTVEQARAQLDSHYDEVIERFAREWREGRTFNFTVRHRASGDAVGSVELRVLDANVSYVVAPAFRGRGLATQAVEALIIWATDLLGLDHVNLICHVENVASHRVAEKCGFDAVGSEGNELRFRRDCGAA